MVSIRNSIYDITTIYQQINYASKIDESTCCFDESTLPKVDSLIASFKKNLFNHKEDYIYDLALHPDKIKTCKTLGSIIRKLDPISFKKIQKILSEIQHEAKSKPRIIIACHNYGMNLKEYEDLMQEFDGNVSGELFDEITYPEGMTPLRKAITLNNPKFVKVLIELGAELNLCDSTTWSPLKWAVEKKSPKMVLLLCEQGANPNVCNKNLWTPLKLAITRGYYEIVSQLQKLGADLNFCIEDAATPLEWAIEQQSPSMVKLLVKLGANVNFCNTIKGGNPLIYAIHKKSPEMVRLLKELGADINLRDVHGCTSLEYAIDNNHQISIRLLSELGAGLNLPNLKGHPPLTQAAMKGKWAAVNELKSLGVDNQFNTKIQQHIELAQVWGLQGIIPINSKNNVIHLNLEGMYPYSAMQLLKNFNNDFFNSSPKISESQLSSQSRTIIQKALERSYPFVKEDDDIVLESIRTGNPYVIESGVFDHAITFVFCKEKLVVCNRGLGRANLACEIFDMPLDKLTLELIRKCKAIYQDIDAFKEMLKELNLTKEKGYRHKDQDVGNCGWVSAKSALGVLFRIYAKNEKEGQKIYKQFTVHCRRRSLEIYLKHVQPPNYKILKILYKKLENKRSFADTKLQIAEILKKHKLETFAKDHLLSSLRNRRTRITGAESYY